MSSFLGSDGLSFFFLSFQLAQIAGEMQIEEYVPARRPIMIGNAKILMSRTPRIATIPIVSNVVRAVFIERMSVSDTDLFAMNVADEPEAYIDLLFSRTLSKIIIVLLIE